MSAFWLKSQLQIAAALSHAISEQQKRTPDDNDNVTCCSPSPCSSLTAQHSTPPLPTLHEALSCQMCLLFQKGLLHPSEVYAPEIFPVFWWGVWGRVSRVSRATLCAPCDATPAPVLRPCHALISPISCKKCRPAQRLSTLSSRFDNFLIYGWQ